MEKIIDKSLLSIIVPVYNVASYLPRCIESLLAQTYTNIEIILVDDGSTDESGQICDKYAMNDKRIKTIHKQNDGLPSAWKCGVKQANGDLIGFVDSDDYCDNSYFYELVKQILDNDADIAICGFTVDYEDDDEINLSLRASNYLNSGVYDGDTLKEIKDNFFNKTTTLYWARWLRVIKRDLIMNNLSFVDEKIKVGEDIGIALATLFDSERIVIVDSYGYHYVQRKTSIMHTVSFKDIANYDRLCKNIQTVCSHKGYAQNVEREYATQLAVLVSKIICSDCSCKEKTNGLKELRKSYYAQKALCKRNFANLSKNRRILLKLFKMRMYRALLLLAWLR